MSNTNTGAISKAANALTEAKKPATIKDYVKQMENEIKKALPSVITPERFTRMVLSALSSTPQLASCTRETFLGAMMNAAQLGLEPNTPLGQAYLIPFRNNKKGITECQFQIGYKGLIDIAYRSGGMASIEARCVYANDEFDYELGLDCKLKHKPLMNGERGELTAVYAMFRLTNGGYYFEVMSVDELRKHAKKYSQSFNSSFSPWNTHFDEMCKKTVLKRVLKYAPLKTEFVRAVSQDETIKNVIDEDMSIIDSTYTEVDDSGAFEETGDGVNDEVTSDENNSEG